MISPFEQQFSLVFFCIPFRMYLVVWQHIYTHKCELQPIKWHILHIIFIVEFTRLCLMFRIQWLFFFLSLSFFRSFFTAWQHTIWDVNFILLWITKWWIKAQQINELILFHKPTHLRMLIFFYPHSIDSSQCYFFPFFYIGFPFLLFLLALLFLFRGVLLIELFNISLRH